MTKKVAVALRKEPVQERSRRMNEVILAAAARVLEQEGAAGFTTNKVAERAGISIGALYQYYPNKAAILFRLHERATAETWSRIRKILDQTEDGPRTRIRRAIEVFFRSEVEEVGLRTALHLAEVYFNDSEEYRVFERAVRERMAGFLAEVGAGYEDFEFGASLLVTVLTSVAQAISSDVARNPEVDRWSRACSDIICDYLRIEG